MATNVWWGYDPRPCDEITWAADALAAGVEPDDIDRRYSLCVRGYAAAEVLAVAIDDSLRVHDSWGLECFQGACQVISEILREAGNELEPAG